VPPCPICFLIFFKTKLYAFRALDSILFINKKKINIIINKSNMSNKFLNPAGVPELDELIVRINDNTVTIDNHIANVANPHATTASQVGIDTSDDVPEGTTNLYMTPAERTELGFITVTQNVNLDTLESDVTTLQNDKIDKDGSIAMTGDFNLGGNDIVSGGVTLDTSTSPNNLIVNTTDGVSFNTPLNAKYSFLRGNNPLLEVDGPQDRVEVATGISTRLNGGLDMNNSSINDASFIYTRNLHNTTSTNIFDLDPDIRITSTTGEIILDNNSVGNSFGLTNTGIVLFANTGDIDLKSVSGEINALSNVERRD
jgi:hypothetical protein